MKQTYAKSALLLCLAAAIPFASGQDKQDHKHDNKKDNTRENKRDRQSNESTADQQKMNAADEELTRKIRQAIMADKSLSTYAQNVKIISQDGRVTLKGPVRSESEKATVLEKAVNAAGHSTKVTNQLTIAP